MQRFYAKADDHPADYLCFYVETSPSSISYSKLRKLALILNLNLDPETELIIENIHESGKFLEIGPQLEFTTPWCSHVMMVLQKSNLLEITRIERSFLYLSEENCYFDKMIQMRYDQPLTSFTSNHQQTKTQIIPLEQLVDYNQKEQLGFDQADLAIYQKIYKHSRSKIRKRSSSVDLSANSFSQRESLIASRQPTDVELACLSNSNSEHSRHWLFRGKLKLDDQFLPHTLFDLIKAPLRTFPNNSLIAMRDNSSAIKGSCFNYFQPNPNDSRFTLIPKTLHPIFTAETHNFPTGIAPFPGAATGTGGRIRDIQAIGRGGLMIAGTAGYCVGNLLLPNCPWEDQSAQYPLHLPSKILLEASDGASDYGNKIGEPLIQGFTRSFGLKLLTNNGETRRIEWIKPIMFSGGIGQMMDEDLEKYEPELGFLIVRLGGPAYRIGVGGGAASSQSQDSKNLNFNAVQRDDPEMENRLQKVIRTLIEMGDQNPILSIHDQGAGGMGNVTQEIVSPVGGLISLGNVQLGDLTLSAKEKWIAEYQEQNTILIHPRSSQLVKAVCLRENLPVQFVGFVSHTGRIQVYDPDQPISKMEEAHPVDLDLNQILEEVPQKTFTMSTNPGPNVLPQKLFQTSPEKIIKQSLKKVFQLVSVGSKRFLTNKVDRSVSGLIAQQQCVGPFQTPMSNVAVVAQSMFDYRGIASAIGEQPIKMQLDPARGAQMAIGEMLTNLIWAPITGFEDIKCSGNWMWEKRTAEEIYALYQAVSSVSETLLDLGIAIDGGKDSLSMSATTLEGERVFSPRSLVMSAYVGCTDIRKVITPDLKEPGHDLLYLDLSFGQQRMGGSAFAQVCHQSLGDQCPDLVNPQALKHCFQVIQDLISNDQIYAGHDRSDGGLITTLIEMAMAGNYGIEIDLYELQSQEATDLINLLFCEELGLVIEVSTENRTQIVDLLNDIVPTYYLGRVSSDQDCLIFWEGRAILNDHLGHLRSLWENTSHQLELQQCDPKCSQAEYQYLQGTDFPLYRLSEATRKLMRLPLPELTTSHQIAILREEGSNGDREMAAAFYYAGFEVIDLTTSDLEHFDLNLVRGLAFVGGFSFADVLGAGRAWSLTLARHREKLDQFYQRPDTFSLGVCNGCQLMSQLGWIPGEFRPNTSGRFESRFATVKVLPSKSIMLQGMEGTTMGVWIAHREGRYQNKVKRKNQSCLRYVDLNNYATEKYPHNPNGSSGGITGVCSNDGRHLAMMPHPERSILSWQAPWMNPSFKEELKDYHGFYPWFEMFRNAYRWCNNEQ